MRKPNRTESRKATKASTWAALDQTISLGNTNKTATDNDMSESNAGTQVPPYTEPSKVSNTDTNITTNAGFPMGYCRRIIKSRWTKSRHQSRRPTLAYSA